MTTKEIEEKPKWLKKIEFSQTVANQFMKVAKELPNVETLRHLETSELRANAEKTQKKPAQLTPRVIVSHNYYIMRSELMELDKFKTMMNVRERMTYFLRFQRMAGSENQVTIDEEAWKLVLPDQWNLSGEHEKAIREGLEIFVHDINSIENKRARKYFIIHYCYMRKKTVSECLEIAGTKSTSYHRYKQIAVLNFARIHQNGELEAYK